MKIDNQVDLKYKDFPGFLVRTNVITASFFKEKEESRRAESYACFIDKETPPSFVDVSF